MLKNLYANKSNSISDIKLSFLKSFRLPVGGREGFRFGLIYGLISSLWICNIFPTESLGIPTFPAGFLLVIGAWLLGASVIAFPFTIWGILRYRIDHSLRPVICAGIVALCWSISPLPMQEPGYLLGYTPWEFLANYGTVHCLTALLVCALESLALIAEKRILGGIWFSLALVTCLLPQPHYKTKRIVSVIIAQPAESRALNASSKNAVDLIKETPANSLVLFPESIFHAGSRPKNWNTLIGDRTVVWGELRAENQKLYNSLIIQDGKKSIIYNKQHLAPGFEWLGPPGIDYLIHELTGWFPMTAGEGSPIWDSIAGHVGLGICYESAWQMPKGTDFSLVITNDDWVGPLFTAQRNFVERIRAVETGRAVVRVDNRASFISYPDRLPEKLPEARGVYMVSIRVLN